MTIERRRPRYVLLDILRGLCVVSMVLYHAMYDLVYIKGYAIGWYRGLPGYLWQQSVCWTFILLSGLCFNLSRRHIWRGISLVLCGTIVTLVTLIFMRTELILFGILTLLGLSALLLNLLQLLWEKLKWNPNPRWGFGISLLLFLLLRDVPQGWLGFEGLHILALPTGLYRWNALAVLGLPSPSFYSSDYFPLIPWFFLFLTGYFLWGMLSPSEKVQSFLQGGNSPAALDLLRPLSFLGRHSLLIYLAHQPLLMLIFLAVPAA